MKKKLQCFSVFNVFALTLSLFVLVFTQTVSSQSWLWAKSANGNSNKIAVDTQGNCYVTGSFQGIINFGSTSLVSIGGFDIFVVKYNSAGTVQWAIKAGSVYDDAGNGIGVDANGNVYVGGHFSEDFQNGNSGVCHFSGTTLTSNGITDVFLAKYNSNGILQWVRQGGGLGDDYCLAMSVDQGGNCYITGSFGFDYSYNYGNYPATFSGVTLTCNGDEDIFVAKYDASGYLLWTEQGAGNTNARATSIVNDDYGNAYITGADFGGVTFDTTYIPGDFSGGLGYYIAKCNSLGWDWAKTCSGSSSKQGTSVCIDSTGNAYVFGDFEDNAIFGTDTLNSLNATSSFIAKYSALGSLIWTKGIYSTSIVTSNIIHATLNDNIIFAGNFKDTLLIGSDTILAKSLGDIFICQADSSGNIQSLNRLGVTNYNYCNDLAVENTGNVYYTGTYRDSIYFGTIPLVNSGLNMFIAKYGLSTVGINKPSIPNYFINNFPNPFSKSTTIFFTLPESEYVLMGVYDISGCLVKTISNSFYSAGKNEITWNAVNDEGSSLATGMYFLKFQTPNYSETKILSLIK